MVVVEDVVCLSGRRRCDGAGWEKGWLWPIGYVVDDVVDDGCHNLNQG